MNNKIFIALVVLAAGVLVGWYFLKGKATTTPTGQTAVVTPTPSGSNLGIPQGVTGMGTSGMEKGGVAARTEVIYSDGGFAPSPVTVKVGSVVTFVNESSGQMQVESDPYPTHSILPDLYETTSVGRAGVYEYTFIRVGTWIYHNRASRNVKGTVIVTR